MDAEEIILYSTGCPKCKILKAKLSAKNIPHTENNSIQDMMALGIETVPVLSVNGKLLPFKAANDWVNLQ